MGDVPLLKQVQGTSGASRWLARPVRELNRDLSNRYGLPIELDAKMGSLSAIARALDRRDLIHAQIATLHLRFPDPPSLAKSKQTTSEVFELAHRLRASGLLKADWDPAKHPRWPAGSSDSVGGRFAPSGGISGDADSNARVIPVQGATITLPARPCASTYNSTAAHSPVASGNHASTVASSKYQSSPHSTESLSRATQVRERMGRSDPRLFALMGKRVVGSRPLFRNG